MAVHNQLGKKGEEMAEAYLLQQGYQVLHRNWRHSHYEIDIIAI
jgi:putative endonuclease